MHRTSLLRAPVLLSGAFLLASLAYADSSIEIAGYGGGMTLDQSGGTHAVAGGSAGIHFGKAAVFGEFNYVPLASASASGNVMGISVTSQGSEKLYNFGGGFTYDFGSSTRVVPYVLGVLGVGHSSVKATGSAANLGPFSISVNASDNAVYGGGGAGVRLYAGQHWGIKPEVRFQRYQQSGGGGNTVLYTVGLFYQFGK
jgi:hypothetical protein